MAGVIEIRTYKLKAGSGAAFHRTVVEESVPAGTLAPRVTE